MVNSTGATEAVSSGQAIRSLFGNEMPTSTITLSCVTILLMSWIFYEQISFQYLKRGGKGNLAGPGLVTPIIGGIITMVKDPYGFWEKQRLYNTNGLSWTSIVGKFCVFVTNTDIIRKVFSNNGPDSFLIVLHPNGSLILGEPNIAFMHGKEHKNLRNSFLTLFSPRALSKYLVLQDKLIHKYMARWVQQKHWPEMREELRDLNLETSQTVFVGPYLKDPKGFGRDYLLMTEGFLSFPIPLPGFGLWKAIQARKRIVDALQGAVSESLDQMKAGKEPQCLLDFWMERIITECDEHETKLLPPPPYANVPELARVMMNFLFASQDASTAALTWCMTLMADYPEILAKVREEQALLRPNNEDMSYELMCKMTYTHQVVKEILRFRPPAQMVPQLVQKDFQLTDDFVCKKGSVVIPSILAACAQGYTNGHEFDPERMGEERGEDAKHNKNFMVFGFGPHKCVGYQYVMNHLITFVGLTASNLTWIRTHTEKSDEMIYLPTLYPHDCILDIKVKEN